MRFLICSDCILRYFSLLNPVFIRSTKITFLPSFCKLKMQKIKGWLTSTLCRRQNRKPVSVLTCHLSSRPTPRKRASNSFALADAPIYMVFLVLVPSPPYVAIQRRELLPRGFTLTLIGRSVFCYGLHKITPICDFHSRILYPVRTFLCLKFLVVISSSLLVALILTTRRLLRYSLLAFLEIPHHKSQTATDRSTYFL